MSKKGGVGGPVANATLFRHLLSNAIKFSPLGSQITLSLKGTDETASIAISDQGIGIPENEREAIFEKFVQSSLTRTGAGGTGLGLAICREIVHLHQGSIRVENVPTGGACFTFTLPMTES
ncbi:hypothetical protein C2W62_00115 [Candidatus Entotheonella serta]|nr:hypothetical protein C2W62_00115 [Candidatus Entotheonella serta]